MKLIKYGSYTLTLMSVSRSIFPMKQRIIKANQGKINELIRKYNNKEITLEQLQNQSKQPIRALRETGDQKLLATKIILLK